MKISASTVAPLASQTWAQLARNAMPSVPHAKIQHRYAQPVTAHQSSSSILASTALINVLKVPIQIIKGLNVSAA